MQQNNLIVITGAAGFIGSYLVGTLNNLGYHNLILVDDFSRLDKVPNFFEKKYTAQVHRNEFITWLEANGAAVDYIFHLGARTDTTLQDKAVFDDLNEQYSEAVWRLATQYQIPLVYASSAATYGGGECGYDDDLETIDQLQPLNPYGWSKQHFDQYVLKQEKHPPFWAGLKFFNVYGPNEYHKGRMASVILHAYRQIKEQGSMKLFRSHNPNYTDGGQLRDFIYVKDLVAVMIWLMEAQPASSIYNLGTGQARTFNDLARSVFVALDKPEQITYIDTPVDIRDSYQYYTQANMDKLRAAGYTAPFTTLEDGVREYVQSYLMIDKYH